MRIIVGRDYYDNALAYGRDDHVTFVRDRDHSIAAEDFAPGVYTPVLNLYAVPAEGVKNVVRGNYSNRESFQIKGPNFEITYCTLKAVAVLVCGKLYHGVKILKETAGPSESHCFWTIEAFKRALRELGCEIHYNKYARYQNQAHFRESEDYNFKQRDLGKEQIAWLAERKVTIATTEPEHHELVDRTWKINGDNLKDYQFYKVMDAFTIFQEIEMWVGGVVAGTGKPMVQITDKDRIHKHGFDKHSFRKSPLS